MNRDSQYRLARRRVAKKRNFFRHLSSYFIVGAFFFTLNILTDPGDIWFFFPMLPWGMGLAFHYLAVFGFPGQRDDWEEREMAKEMARIENREQRLGRTIETDDYDELELRDLSPRERRMREKQWREDDFV